MEALEQAFAAWLKTTWLSHVVIENPIVFTACETLHFMGLTMLAGALLAVDLRGLGFFSRVPLIEIHKLVPVAIIGFVINLITGVTFVASNPMHYFHSLSFNIKIALVVLAGLNAIAFEFLVFRPLLAGAPNVEKRAVTRVTSGASIALWGGVLIFGRLIPYV